MSQARPPPSGLSADALQDPRWEEAPIPSDSLLDRFIHRSSTGALLFAGPGRGQEGEAHRAPRPGPPSVAVMAKNRGGLFRMPPPRLVNRYFLVRAAGECVYEGQGLLCTNPIAKTSVDSDLSPVGLRQTARAALDLQRLGACKDDCWIWPSITQRAYQAAEIIAAANSINRSCIVVEYSFLDARRLGAFEGKSLDTLPEVYASDNITLSSNMKHPTISDGTPNESVADVFVQVT